MILSILPFIAFWYKTLKMYRRDSVVVAFVDSYSRSSFNLLYNYSIEDMKLRGRWVLLSLGFDQMVLQTFIVKLTGVYSPTFFVGYFIFLGGIFLLLDQETYQKFRKKSSWILRVLLFPLIITVTGILIKDDWSTKLLNDPSFASLTEVARLRLIEITYSLFVLSALIMGVFYVFALLIFAFAWLNFHTSNKLCFLIKRFLKHCINNSSTDPHTMALHWLKSISLLVTFTHALFVVLKFALR